MIKSMLQAVSAASRHGYQIFTYQDKARTEKDMQLLLSVSEYGFTYTLDGKKLILINADQPDEEVILSLWHEIGHIALATEDEQEADNFARQMIGDTELCQTQTQH